MIIELLIVVGIIFIVFSHSRNRGRVVFVYNMSAREMSVWWLIRMLSMVVMLVILYFLYPSIITLVKSVIASGTQNIESFVASLPGLLNSIYP